MVLKGKERGEGKVNAAVRRERRVRWFLCHRDALCTSEVPVGGRKRKTQGQSANGDISCACFIR